MGRLHPKLGDVGFLPGALGSTLLIVAGWSFFILTGSIATIWPMFGVANQLLAATALSVATTIILRESKKRWHAVVTLGPLLFVGTTTITAGIKAMLTLYLPMTERPETSFIGKVNLLVTGILLVCVAMVIIGSARKWIELVARPAEHASTT
jgi:carbon starvation protein